MIQYERFVLDNGLRCIVHEDNSTPLAVMNVLYDVGARDENAEKTGMAHLFEHLMFGGSLHIPNYDEPLQKAGGENNAFTTNDITDYYCQLPAQNIETAFWLESDRMLQLAFHKQSLEVQKKVVCEEFKEHYLNKPYGDLWHKMRDLAYTVHPYKWMTIGKELSHIEKVTLNDVTEFFYKHYRPVNAVLVVAGHVKTAQIKQLAEKWFGSIPMGEKYNRQLPQEPIQTEPKRLAVEADVPLDAFCKTWHMDARMEKGYYVSELITDILGGGASSRLYQSLVKEQKIFTNIDCYHFGSIDKGLLAIEGKLVKGQQPEHAEQAVEAELEKLKTQIIPEAEVQKIKNKAESSLVFEDVHVATRAMNLAYYELLGNANLINEELAQYQAISAAQIQQHANEIFQTANSHTLYYLSKQ